MDVNPDTQIRKNALSILSELVEVNQKHCENSASFNLEKKLWKNVIARATWSHSWRCF